MRFPAIISVLVSVGLASCASLPAYTEGPANCEAGGLSTPKLLGEVTFEDATDCPLFAGAYNRQLIHAPHPEDGDRANAVIWMESVVAEDERFFVDQFGRIHAFQCAKEDIGDEPQMLFGDSRGEGDNAKEIYVTMTLPLSAEQCAT